MDHDAEINMLIITGMSGAGKSVTVQILEDLGFFCVDNLPPILIPKFAELIEQSDGKIEKVALVIDLRGREFFESLFDAFDRLDESSTIQYKVLFLDASDQVLVRRYKETRRRHPLASGRAPLEGIQVEREMLDELKGRASQIIDTSEMKSKELREKMSAQFSSISNQLSINVLSFGFKYGIPIDADLVFDIRFLPNPHYVNSLKEKTGQDREVYDYVFKWSETRQYVQKLTDLIRFSLPHYQREGKSQLVIGIGCTGGKHRSVALATYLGEQLTNDYAVHVTHRDIKRD